MKTKIKVRNLDLSTADGYAVTNQDVVMKAIRRDRLSGRRLLFSGLEGRELSTLLEHGTLHPDSKFIYASPSLEGEYSTSMEPDILDYATERNVPMLAVYDAKQFRDAGNHHFEFLHPDRKLESLLIVYLLKV